MAAVCQTRGARAILVGTAAADGDSCRAWIEAAHFRPEGGKRSEARMASAA